MKKDRDLFRNMDKPNFDRKPRPRIVFLCLIAYLVAVVLGVILIITHKG